MRMGTPKEAATALLLLSLSAFPLEISSASAAAAAAASSSSWTAPSLQQKTLPRNPHPSRSSCRAIPGSPDWPAPEAWSRLNESTGGRLLRPTPPGAVCHPGQPSYDAQQCAAVVQPGWSTYEFHRADPVSLDNQQWNNDSCLPWPDYPCSSDGYPSYVVNASTPEHVQAAVKFAREKNVRLIVKASGHDFQGRSSAPNSLSIWTQHMQGISFYHDSFQPKCCSTKIEGTAVTALAGTDMYDLYSATAVYNLTVVGGGGKTVGVGGYITGGGHSILSSSLGLAADQVLEMEIVTPKGEIKTLNECQNRDLFWAMRGGGGSTFGVMTSVTLKTHPSPSMLEMVVVIATNDVTRTDTYDMGAFVLSNYPSLSDAGVSGYSFLFDNQSNPFDGGATRVAGWYGAFAMLNVSDPAVARALWDPIYAHVNATWPGVYTYLTIPSYSESFKAWFDVHYDQSKTGGDSWVGSRLLDEQALTGDLTALAAAYKQFSAAGGSTAYLVSGKGVHNAKPRGGGNAVNPGWRTAYVHATNGAEAAYHNLTDRAATISLLNHTLVGMRALAPNTGAYVNEAFTYEPDWQRTFWGDNYPRLLKIKRRVDPDDVLWCHPCVGNERWHVVNDQLCRI